MLRAKFRCSLHGRLECANFGASAKTATEGRMLWRPLSFSGHSFQLVPSSLRVPVSGTRKPQFSSVTFASRERPNFARIARKTPPPKFRKTLRETLGQGNPLPALTNPPSPSNDPHCPSNECEESPVPSPPFIHREIACVGRPTVYRQTAYQRSLYTWRFG